MTELVMDNEQIMDKVGEYDMNTNIIHIYLATVWNEFHTFHALSEDLIICRITDIIHHEWIHACIDDCLDGIKPEDVDDHKIFKYLVVW